MRDTHIGRGTIIIYTPPSHWLARQVIVVHNCKEVIDEETLHYVWESQVTAIHGSGTIIP